MKNVNETKTTITAAEEEKEFYRQLIESELAGSSVKEMKIFLAFLRG